MLKALPTVPDTLQLSCLSYCSCWSRYYSLYRLLSCLCSFIRSSVTSQLPATRRLLVYASHAVLEVVRWLVPSAFLAFCYVSLAGNRLVRRNSDYKHPFSPSSFNTSSRIPCLGGFREGMRLFGLLQEVREREGYTREEARDKGITLGERRGLS